MPTKEDVGEGGVEGAQKALESMIDSMAPLLGDSKKTKRKNNDSDDDDDKKRRRRDSNTNNTPNNEDKTARFLSFHTFGKRKYRFSSKVTPEQAEKKAVDKDLKGSGAYLFQVAVKIPHGLAHVQLAEASESCLAGAQCRARFV